MDFDASYDVKNIFILTSNDVPPSEVRLLSANEMYEVCYAFLSVVSEHIKNRWIPSKECRNALAHRLLKNCPSDWITLEARRGLIQRVTRNIVQQENFFLVPESAHWETEEELVTDIRNAVEATRKTISLFALGDPKYVPAPTDLFAVSGKMNEFLASFLLGEVRPVWMTCVDSAQTPYVNDGLYPKYPPRIV